MVKKLKQPIGKKKLLLLLLLFAAGLALLLLGGLGEADEESERGGEPSVEEYRRELSEEIVQLCRQVKGVGRVTVLLSFSGGYEYVYARDGDGDCLSVGSGSGKQAVVENVLPPAVSGLGIVCDGGENAAVREELTALLSAALGIGANKIYITS